MFSIFRAVGLAVVFLIGVCVCEAQDKAQDKKDQSEPDKIKLSVAFSNSEYSDLFSTEYAQGITAELDARMFKRNGFRLGGVFQWNRANVSDPIHLDTYSFGPQLSYDLFKGHVAPFGRALFGFQTTYQLNKTFSRTYGGGLDINLGHVFLRPIAVDYQKIEGAPGAIQKFSAGVGVRF